jgi:hypothetical protein
MGGIMKKRVRDGLFTPFIIYNTDPEEGEMVPKNVTVVFDTAHWITCKTLLEAVDICHASFHVFGLEYPQPCRDLWLLIESLYNPKMLSRSLPQKVTEFVYFLESLEETLECTQGGWEISHKCIRPSRESPPSLYSSDGQDEGMTDVHSKRTKYRLDDD